MRWPSRIVVLGLLLSTAAFSASPPAITISFNPSPVNVSTGATQNLSQLTFTITNPNSGMNLTGVGFTDVLPSGLVSGNASVPVCGGTLTVSTPSQVTASSNSTITLSGATVPNPGPPCTFPLGVLGLSAGLKINTTGAVTSTEGGTGNTASANLDVQGPPVLTKSFTPDQILVNQTSTMAFTIQNPNSSLTLTGIGFSDSLPTNLVIATPNGLSGSCGGGTISANAGGGSLSLTGASLAGGASCTFSVKVTSSVASIYPNVVTQVNSTEEGAGGPAIAKLTVVGPPSITKSFGKALLPLAQVTTLSITVTNPNPTVALTGVGFSDTLPSGLLAPANSLSVCGGTLTITNVSNITTITLSGASLTPPSANVCPLPLAVVGIIPGVQNNTTSVVTSNEAGNGPSASASITVVAPPVIVKSFSQLSIPVGSSTALTFSIKNPNVPVALTGVGFNDALPQGLVVSSPNGLTGSCGGGTITAVPGTATINLTGATLPPTALCTFSVNVTAVAEGVQNNTTSAVDSVEGGPGNTASASIATGSVFQVDYSTNLTLGDSVLRFTNSGVSSTVPSPAQDGSLCLNIYQYTAEAKLAACCTCTVKPDSLLTLSATRDLLPRPYLGDSMVVKTISTLSNACNPATIGTPGNPLAPGILAWRTNVEPTPSGSGVVPVRSSFKPAPLSGAELTSMAFQCALMGGGLCSACGGAIR